MRYILNLQGAFQSDKTTSFPYSKLLVNLIMDKEVVTELIQNDFNTKRLKQEVDIILDNYERTKFFINYYELEKKLGGKGASRKVATLIYNSINT